jgi:hypothetical protein
MWLFIRRGLRVWCCIFCGHFDEALVSYRDPLAAENYTRFECSFQYFSTRLECSFQYFSTRLECSFSYRVYNDFVHFHRPSYPHP